VGFETVIAYAAPVVAGVLVPFFLACGRRRSAIIGAAAVSLLALAASGSFGAAAYVVVISIWFGGIFEALRVARVPRTAAQVACGFVLAAMLGVIFISNALLDAAETKQGFERVIWAVSNASPIVVMGTILGDDPSRWRWMYSLSRLADYGVVRSDLSLVFGALGVAGLLGIGAGLLKKDGSQKVFPTDPVQTPR
jgi:hypothetical protein